jgi:YNFM family putative membrane transporter
MYHRVVVILAFVAFAAAASLRSIDALLVPIAEDFGTTAGGAAIASSAFLASYGLAQLVHGPMGDRIGKIRLTVIHLAVGGLAMFASAAAPTLTTLALLRFVAGASAGALITLALAWIGDRVPMEKRQTVLAQFMIGQMFGIGIGAAAAGLIAEWIGWRAVLVALGVLFAVAGIALWREMRANPLAREEVGVPGASFAQDFGRVFLIAGRPWVRVMLAVVFVEGLLLFGSVGWMPLHAHLTLGLGIGASGALVVVFALGGLAYSLAASRLVPRMGELGIVRLGGVTMVSGLALSAFAPNVPAAALGFFLVGVGMYSFHNVIQVHGTQMTPDARGAGVSMFALFLFGSQSLGVWAGSFVVDAVGTAPLLAGAALGMVVLCMVFDVALSRRAG